MKWNDADALAANTHPMTNELTTSRQRHTPELLPVAVHRND
jgi:hypothetical protein